MDDTGRVTCHMAGKDIHSLAGLVVLLVRRRGVLEELFIIAISCVERTTKDRSSTSADISIALS